MIQETEILHSIPECVGNWRLPGLSENRTVKCDRCDVQAPASPENRLAAINENYAGLYLRRMTSEGVAFLGHRLPTRVRGERRGKSDV